MANLRVEIRDTQETITRRIALDVVKGIAGALSLPPEVTVHFPSMEDTERVRLTENTDEAAKRMYPSCTFKIVVTDITDEQYAQATLIQKNETRPIFRDTKLGILASPVYERRIMTINLAINCPDKVIADRIRNDMRYSSLNNRLGLFHEAEYHYIIPDVFLAILTRLFKSTNEYRDDAQTMGEWLDERFDTQVVRKSTVAGVHTAFVKNEVIKLLYGLFDFKGQPNETQSEEHGTKHVIEFGYEVKYDRPLSLMLEYPIFIHNRRIDKQLIDFGRKYVYEDLLEIPTRTTYLNALHGRMRDLRDANDGISIPHYDDWSPKHTHPYTQTLFKIRVIVNQDDSRELFNLGELGEVNFKEPVLRYMRKNNNEVLNHRQALILVTLYINGEIADSDKLTLDSDLNLRTTMPMCPQNNYHIRISAYTKLRHLTQGGSDELRNNPDVCNIVLGGIDGRLIANGVLPLKPIGNTITKRDFENAAVWIERNGTKEYGDKPCSSYFVLGSYLIIGKE